MFLQSKYIALGMIRKGEKLYKKEKRYKKTHV
jgi:hypothetical protein